MTLDLFEAELAGHPDRGSAVDLYRHMLDLARRIETSDHSGVVDALRAWLKLRSEPRTMIAADLAGKLRLTELRDELERLRSDVQAGRAFLPYYTRWIEDAIQSLS